MDRTHPLLDDNYRFGLDYIDNDSDPNDLQGHGTHVSGTIGAEDENIGVAPDVGLIGLRAGDADGIFPGAAANSALEWVLNEVNSLDSEYNIVAVNLSFGTSDLFTAPNQPNSSTDVERRRLIQELEAAGVVVVASAGNDYIGKRDSEGNVFDVRGNPLDRNQEPNVSAPAIYSTLAVGAVWQNDIDPFNTIYSNLQIPGADRIAVFSQRLNADNFLFAPGAFITSTVPQKPNGELFEHRPGTSQASPHVAGSVALLQEIAAGYGVRLSPEQVRDYLINNADIIVDGDDEEDTVVNTNISYPRINIHSSAIALREDLENNNFAPDPLPTDPNTLPNDLIDGAIDVTLGNDREPLVFPGVLGTDRNVPVASADVDLYRLTLPDNGVLNIDIDTPYLTDFPDSYLRLFNESGEELFFTNNDQLVASDDDLAPGEVTATLNSTGETIVLDDENRTDIVDGFFDEGGIYQPGNYGHATDSYLSFTGERGQTYYIGVSDFSNQQYNPLTLDNRPAPLSTDGGSYELIATFINDDVDGSIDSAIASLALPTNSLTGFIGNDGATEVGDKDVDFYRVNSPTPGILEIEINSVTEASIIDSVDSVTEYYIGINGYSLEAGDYDPFTGEGAAPGSQGDYTLSVGDVGITGLDLLDDDSEFSIYRFFREDVGVHFYTSDRAERDHIQANLPNFNFEGASYQSVDPTASTAEVTPVYRFLNQNTGVHLYTTSETERDIVRELDNFSFEGEAFEAYTSEIGREVEDAIPIYRFLNVNTGAHFYTPSVAERDNVEANLPDFQSEGIAYYAFPTDIVQRG